MYDVFSLISVLIMRKLLCLLVTFCQYVHCSTNIAKLNGKVL